MSSLALKIRRFVEAILCLSLFSMVALTFADVIGRRLFGRPIYGAYDITEHQMAIIVFCGLPLVTAVGGHLTIDLFDRLVNSPAMSWWRYVIRAIMMIILALIAFMFFEEADKATEIAAVSEVLLIPRAPLYLFMSVSSLLAALAVLVPGRGERDPERSAGPS